MNKIICLQLLSDMRCQLTGLCRTMDLITQRLLDQELIDEQIQATVLSSDEPLQKGIDSFEALRMILLEECKPLTSSEVTSELVGCRARDYSNTVSEVAGKIVLERLTPIDINGGWLEDAA